MSREMDAITQSAGLKITDVKRAVGSLWAYMYDCRTIVSGNSVLLQTSSCGRELDCCVATLGVVRYDSLSETDPRTVLSDFDDLREI